MAQVSGNFKLEAMKRPRFAGLKMCFPLNLIIYFEAIARSDRKIKAKMGWW